MPGTSRDTFSAPFSRHFDRSSTRFDLDVCPFFHAKGLILDTFCRVHLLRDAAICQVLLKKRLL